MSTSAAIILLIVALALYIVGRLLIPRPQSRPLDVEPLGPRAGVEPELLRRPLRSRLSA